MTGRQSRGDSTVAVIAHRVIYERPTSSNGAAPMAGLSDCYQQESEAVESVKLAPQGCSTPGASKLVVIVPTTSPGTWIATSCKSLAYPILEIGT